jgi:hypothetical protein
MCETKLVLIAKQTDGYLCNIVTASGTWGMTEHSKQIRITAGACDDAH